MRTDLLAADPTTSTRADRILDAFGERAGPHGVRAVVMGDLARQLGMSTKTLYREFPTKDALVVAFVARWAADLSTSQRSRQSAGMPAEERLRQGTRDAVALRHRYSDAFWDDLRSDHPAAWSLYVDTLRALRRSAWERIQPDMRDDIDRRLAWQLIDAAVERALQPEVLARTGLDLDGAIDAAIAIWARGALR